MRVEVKLQQHQQKVRRKKAKKKKKPIKKGKIRKIRIRWITHNVHTHKSDVFFSKNKTKKKNKSFLRTTKKNSYGPLLILSLLCFLF